MHICIYTFVLLPQVTVSDDTSMPERSGLDLYFSPADGAGNGGSGSSGSSSKKPFVATVLFRPYFYVLLDPSIVVMSSSVYHSSMDNTNDGSSNNEPAEVPVVLELIRTHLRNTYECAGLYACNVVYRQDLDQANHLSPSNRHGRVMLQLVFDTTAQLIEVRTALHAVVAANAQKRQHGGIGGSIGGGTAQWESMLASGNSSSTSSSTTTTLDSNPMVYLTDLREYDVPYAVRVCTDLDIRAGCWYTVHWQDDDGHPALHFGASENQQAVMDLTDDEPSSSLPQSSTPSIWTDTGGVRLSDPDRELKAEPVVLAFDIECTKAPLKFPSADVDEIFMISYMVSDPTHSGRPAQGYLITSRSVVSADVHDFEYTPKPNYPGPFIIFNEADEKALLQRFFAEFRRHCPQIVVTYNGDFFDFPFVDARAQHHGLNLFREIGLSLQGGNGGGGGNNGSAGGGNNNNDAGGYRGQWTVHLDAFHWVQRDSYLPQGAQGLKAVTKYKLGYDPVEVDPEDMLRFAHEKPVHMATYSVSDAVATYYLYDKYVHLFIFSLATMIPMGPEDVLSKGSGTLCEALLMVQACKKNIICPNKQVDPMTQFHKGHLLEAETYIGGKVECLESGVFRSDLLYDFDLQPKGFQQLLDNLDRDLVFAIEVEGGKQRADITNYEEVRMYGDVVLLPACKPAIRLSAWVVLTLSFRSCHPPDSRRSCQTARTAA
jgi:DNA polymerase epsilon subunit 1